MESRHGRGVEDLYVLTPSLLSASNKVCIWGVVGGFSYRMPGLSVAPDLQGELSAAIASLVAVAQREDESVRFYKQGAGEQRALALAKLQEHGYALRVRADIGDDLWALSSSATRSLLICQIL